MMKNYTRNLTLVIIGIASAGISLYGQKQEKEEVPQGYQFTVEKSIPATPVKNQHRTSTCWSFATTSFIESELLRIGKGEYDLSEIYFVRKAFELKAEKYVRLHGKINFESGGLAMDVMHIWNEYGMVPNVAYDGLTIGDSLHVHGEIDAVLKGYVDQVITNRNHKLTPVWMDGFKGILDAYLGADPVEFEYEGKTYTPQSFSGSLGLDPSDYVAIGSYTHHPFYEQFIIEIPDNWLWGTIENVPLNELMALLDHALENGYSVCWDADVGEKGYDWKRGIALLPSMEITQENRQEAFDNYQTTDDHLMHITGTATDQQGNKFYLVKNSWGTENHIYKGYHYISEAYMQSKTIFLMLHKDALPASIASKLGL
ncbi:MAG: C1 family peptidase [Bacteroidota bacterium]